MSAHATVNLVRSRWDPELVSQSLLGVCRFDDFRNTLGISRQVLAQRLKELVAEGILTRQPYSSHPDRYEYTLTEQGRDLIPVLVEMLRWSERWRPHAQTPVWFVAQSQGAG
jgi:DNA-binding HxlR family transcriptional regulator